MPSSADRCRRAALVFLAAGRAAAGDLPLALGDKGSVFVGTREEGRFCANPTVWPFATAPGRASDGVVRRITYGR